LAMVALFALTGVAHADGETIDVTVPATSAAAPVTTTTGSGSGLVFTGADVVGVVIGGLALVVAGLVFALVSRRRRRLR
ncbi:MAG TPA: hypothetical protein VF892_04240, partial [Pseudonocardiaceae bacterium]